MGICKANAALDVWSPARGYYMLPQPCHDPLCDIHGKGIIERYRATIEASALNYNMRTFLTITHRNPDFSVAYADLVKLQNAVVRAVGRLNRDTYVCEQIKKHPELTLDQARDRYDRYMVTLYHTEIEMQTRRLRLDKAGRSVYESQGGKVWKSFRTSVRYRDWRIEHADEIQTAFASGARWRTQDRNLVVRNVDVVFADLRRRQEALAAAPGLARAYMSDHHIADEGDNFAHVLATKMRDTDALPAEPKYIRVWEQGKNGHHHFHILINAIVLAANIEPYLQEEYKVWDVRTASFSDGHKFAGYMTKFGGYMVKSYESDRIKVQGRRVEILSSSHGIAITARPKGDSLLLRRPVGGHLAAELRAKHAGCYHFASEEAHGEYWAARDEAQRCGYGMPELPAQPNTLAHYVDQTVLSAREIGAEHPAYNMLHGMSSILALQQYLWLYAMGDEESGGSDAVADALRGARRSSIPVDEMQESVLEAFVNYEVVVVTGGAGTGKTQVIAYVLDSLAEGGYPMDRVAVLSPTGPACEVLMQRLPVSCWDRVKTMHKWLGYRGAENGFRYSKDNVVPGIQFVVVEEASMFSPDDLYRIVSSFPNHDIRFLVVGDENQLPHMLGGIGIREAAALEAVHVIQLHINYRSASQMAVVADGVSRGVYAGPVSVYDPETVAARAIETGAQVLTNLRRTAVEITEAWMRLADASGRGGQEGVRIWGGTVRIGDPVVTRRNVYRGNRFAMVNGESGVIAAIDIAGVDHGVPTLTMTTLAGMERVIPLSDCFRSGTITLGVARTVHSAQGSQYQDVMVCLAEPHDMAHDFSILNRNLLYVAVSRAVHGVEMVVQEGLLLSSVLGWRHRSEFVRWASDYDDIMGQTKLPYGMAVTVEEMDEVVTWWRDHGVMLEFTADQRRVIDLCDGTERYKMVWEE